MFRKSLVALAVLAAAGCASVPPNDPLMVDARMSVNAAQSNPQVAIYAPSELAQAVETLRKANDLADNGGGVGEVHQLATLASQRAALAQQVARTRAEEAAMMAQRRATEAQMTAEVSRRQAESAQMEAAAAQRQAEEAQRAATTLRGNVYAPTGYDYHRRENERLYEAPVTDVRAVVGPAQNMCWVEPTVVDSRIATGMNVPGAIVGGAVGGILGHQIGDGRGRDIATGIGIVGGAAVGANIGRTSDAQVYTDVRRCTQVPASVGADYWDVTYSFAGYQHRVQLIAPPGATILVNAEGEPRV